MDHAKFIVSNQKEESISAYRVKQCTYSPDFFLFLVRLRLRLLLSLLDESLELELPDLEELELLLPEELLPDDDEEWDLLPDELKEKQFV